MAKKIKLGTKVKDPITGYEGIAMARTSYLYGCDTIGVQAPMRDGKVAEWKWFDELRLKRMKGDKNRGGPQPVPDARHVGESR